MAYKPSPQTLARAALARSKMSTTKQISVKQASMDVKPTERAKQLASKSATAYGAGKNSKPVGGQDGGSGNVAAKHGEVTVWPPDKVAALNKQRGTEPVELSPTKKREAIIAAAAKRVAAKKERSFDVPTLPPQSQHDDLRDVHYMLHGRVTRSSMDEEVESVNEDQAADWQKVQSMEKGSMTGGKDAMRTHLKYLNAVHAHQKKHGLDTVKTKKKIEGINRTLVQLGEEVEQLDEIGNTEKGVERLKKYIASDRSKVKIKDVLDARRSADPDSAIEKLAKRQGYKSKALKKIRAFDASKNPKPYTPKELHQIVYPPDMKYHGDSVELNGPVISEMTNNPGHGYHGQHSDDADQKYSKMHARVRTLTGTNSTMAKHYLDSTHGRHLAGNEDDHEYIKRDFLKFAKKYNADQFKEEVEQVDEISIINGKRQDPKSLVWKQTSMSYSVAVSKYGKENVKIEGKNRLGQPVVHVKVPLVGEETEQVDELKKSTLASYVKKAAFHGALNSAHHAYAASAGDIKNQEYHGRKSIKRQKGIATAVDKLAREEVEQVDEMQQGKEYTQKQLQDKIKSGNWEASYDIKPGKNVEMRHRSGKKVTVMVKNVQEEVEQVVEQDETMEKVEMAQTQLHFICYAANEIIEFVKMGGEVEEWYQNKLSKVHSDMESLHSYIEGEKRRTGMVKEDAEQVDEKAPPGAKYERMVKHIKAKYAKDGLTGKEKSIAYATAWKAYGKKNEETVTEAEGTVAVTPREKALAAHHGDPKKITYGDVIRARLKSAAAKKKGE